MSRIEEYLENLKGLLEGKNVAIPYNLHKLTKILQDTVGFDEAVEIFEYLAEKDKEK